MTEWGWVDHACRFCGARLVVRPDAKGQPVYECGTCGVSSNGAPEGICGCGVHLGTKARAKGPFAPAPPGMRWRCVPNPSRGPASLATIVIQHDKVTPE